ncbi:MAG: YgfZ/GcvT domain-containing protein [Marinomonas colpomeniae]
MTSPYNTITSSLQGKTATARLQNIGILRVTGVDAKKLLQGQITCDINNLSSHNGLYGAICNIKGRIISSFYIVQKDDDILMLMAKDLVETTLSHLKKYAVFFKTTLINDNEVFHIYARMTLNNMDIVPEQLSETLPITCENKVFSMTLSHYPVDTQLLISDPEDLSIKEENQELIALSALAARPIITQAQSETFLPQWLNMQRTGGISFTKGCYTGQEIVARMQYRGKSKKQLALFQWKGTLDITKEIVDDQSKNIGNIFAVTNVQDIQLAQVILNIDPSETEHFFLDSREISILPLPYSLGAIK